MFLENLKFLMYKPVHNPYSPISFEEIDNDAASLGYEVIN